MSHTEDSVKEFCSFARIERGTALENDVRRMIEGESSEMHCIPETACERMKEWFVESGNYAIGIELHDAYHVDIKEMREFVAGYRQACVWTVLLGIEKLGSELGICANCGLPVPLDELGDNNECSSCRGSNEATIDRL